MTVDEQDEHASAAFVQRCREINVIIADMDLKRAGLWGSLVRPAPFSVTPPLPPACIRLLYAPRERTSI